VLSNSHSNTSPSFIISLFHNRFYYYFLGGQLGYTHKEILYWTMPERTPYTYDTMMYQYTGHGAVKTDQVSQAEADGEQNTEDEEVLVELEDAEIENGEPVQATTAGGFSTKKFSVVLGAITFMWYYLSMVMWW
jgi:hypothetical protein